MYKIVLIDDEKFALNTLLNSVDWSKYGFSVAGSFFDSLAALEFIRENQIDAIITDIKMPKLSGMELAKILSKEFPEIKVVILSGYDDFEYAREAIEYKVFKYLLKPVGYLEMYGMLEELAQQLKKDNIDRLDKYIKDDKSLAFQKVFSDFKKGKLDLSALCKEASKQGVNIDDNTTVVFFDIHLQELENYLNNVFDYGIQRLYIAIENLIKKRDIFFFPIGYSFDHIECIAVSDIDDKSQFIEKLRSECGELISNCFELLNLDIEIYYKNIFNKFACLNSKNERRAEELISLIKNFDAAKISEISKDIINEKDNLPYIIDLIIGKLLVIELNKLGQKSDKLTIQKLMSSYSYEKEITSEFVISFLEEFECVVRSPKSEEDDAGNDMITKIKEYVNENYTYGISLVSIATKFNINPSYLSRYFKKKTGEKYIDYLNRIRIEKAEQMLMNSNIKISEIAQLVGYQDIKYFYKIFKNLKGVTPQSLRKE